MKQKIVFVLILTLSIHSYTVAQTIKIGIEVGSNISDMRLVEKPDIPHCQINFTPIITFNASSYFSFNSNSWWGVSIEPGFIQKGCNYSKYEDFKTDDSKILLNCIQIPVLFDFHIFKNIKFSLGPEFSYAISTKLRSDDFYILPPEFNNAEISGLLGLSYKLSRRLDLGIRYNHGISSSKITWTDTFGNVQDFSKEYNQRLQLILRFLLKA